jgi:hypothetical protein
MRATRRDLIISSLTLSRQARPDPWTVYSDSEAAGLTLHGSFRDYVGSLKDLVHLSGTLYLLKKHTQVEEGGISLYIPTVWEGAYMLPMTGASVGTYQTNACLSLLI